MHPLPLARGPVNAPRRAGAWSLLLLVVLVPLLALLRGAGGAPVGTLGASPGTRLEDVGFGIVSAFGDGGGLVAMVALAVSVLVATRRTADAAFVLAVAIGATVITPVMKDLYDLARPATFGQAASAAIVIPSAWVAAGAALGVAVGLLTPHRRRAAITGGAVLLLLAAEAITYRVAPVRGGYDSFPSGHAIGSMALASAVVLVSARDRRHWLIAAAAIAYAVTVGLSRMYLGFHYPADVAAGWCIAGAWALAVWLVWPVITGAAEARGWLPRRVVPTAAHTAAPRGRGGPA